jgi:hypothetical protein
MVGAEHLDQRARRRHDVLLAFGDPAGEVFEAWRAKEAVRDLYTMWGHVTFDNPINNSSIRTAFASSPAVPDHRRHPARTRGPALLVPLLCMTAGCSSTTEMSPLELRCLASLRQVVSATPDRIGVVVREFAVQEKVILRLEQETHDLYSGVLRSGDRSAKLSFFVGNQDCSPMMTPDAGVRPSIGIG